MVRCFVPWNRNQPFYLKHIFIIWSDISPSSGKTDYTECCVCKSCNNRKKVRFFSFRNEWIIKGLCLFSENRLDWMPPVKLLTIWIYANRFVIKTKHTEDTLIMSTVISYPWGFSERSHTLLSISDGLIIVIWILEITRLEPGSWRVTFIIFHFWGRCI